MGGLIFDSVLPKVAILLNAWSPSCINMLPLILNVQAPKLLSDWQVHNYRGRKKFLVEFEAYVSWNYRKAKENEFSNILRNFRTGDTKGIFYYSIPVPKLIVIQYSCLKYKMKTAFIHYGAETQFRLNPALIPNYQRILN